MKMFEYAGPDVFQNLFHLFYRRLILEEAENLVVLGYGFRDRGINNMIINWVHNSPEKRMVIIDPHIEDMKKDTAYLNIGKLWKRQDFSNRIIEVNNKLCDISWNDIKEKLSGASSS